MNSSVLPFVKKELWTILRDRRAILISFFLPILMYPVMFSLIGGLEKEEEEKAEARVSKVAVTGEASYLRDAIAQDPRIELVALSDTTAILEAISNKELHAWLHGLTEEERRVRELAAAEEESDDDTEDEGDAEAEAASDRYYEDGQRPPTMRLAYLGSEDPSREALGRVREVLDDWRESERQRRFEASGGTESLAEVIDLRDIDVATEAEAGGAEAGRLIPYLLVLSLFAGAASLSVDVVAGEKERGTLETLYLAPVSRHVIARAKLVVVVLVTVVSGALNVGSMLLCYRFGLINPMGEGGAFAVSGTGLAVSLALILPLSVLVGAVVLGVSAYARSVREAQNYMTPVILIAIIPGLMASSQDVKFDSFTALLPLANVALAVRDGLRGAVQLPTLAIAAAASIFWGWIVTFWTARVLSREETILGFDPEPLLAKTPSGRRRAALLGMALTVLAYFYLGIQLQQWDLPKGLALSLWVLLPALGAGTTWVAWSGGTLKRLLSLRRPSMGSLVAAVLIGVGMIIPMQDGLFALQLKFLPMPENFGEELELGLDLAKPLLLFLIAFTPGVTEELVFRGAFLGLLRRVGSLRGAVLISSLYFGVIHLSVFRLMPTFAIGLVMAWLVVRSRSIFPAMLSHMVYNGATSLLADSESTQEMLQGGVGWGVSLAMLAIGTALMFREKPADESDTEERAPASA